MGRDLGRGMDRWGPPDDARRRPAGSLVPSAVVQLSGAELAGLAALGVFAGWLGALIGIGGGIIVVPALVLAFGYDIHLAVAVSLVCVVATSTAAGSAYVGEGLAHMRLGMALEVATTVGGIAGGLIAVAISPRTLSVVFAGVVLATAVLAWRGREADAPEVVADGGEPGPGPGAAGSPPPSGGWETPGTLAGAYVDPRSGVLVEYRAERLGLGAGVSALAGMLSGMLGVGGGFLKVPAMTVGMKVPIKVAAATSNFMIGVTAIASLLVYFARGYLRPLVAAPIALGVVAGALLGSRLAARTSPALLRRVLVAVLVFVALQMALKAFGVDIGR